MSALSVVGNGLAGWLSASVKSLKVRQESKESSRQMKVLETLSLGPQKQLLLVRCGEECFLVGTGTESVMVIQRVAPGTKV